MTVSLGGSRRRSRRRRAERPLPAPPSELPVLGKLPGRVWKIATFNINGVNRRLANLLGWLNASQPNVVCLQELKSTDDAFPTAAIQEVGYRAIWRGQRTYNGVAILTNTGEPQQTRDRLPGDGPMTNPANRSGGKGDACRVDLPAQWQSATRPQIRLQACLVRAPHRACGEPLRAGRTCRVGRRFRCESRRIHSDIYPSRSWANDALLQPESRACFRRLLDQGWVDAIRACHPNEPMYTFWDYKRDRWHRDAGFRIDFLLLNAMAAERLVDAGVDRAPRGQEGASDHAPAWVTLRRE